jgi:uncharacterized membrane protein YkvA (DUF1232 family)
MSLTDTLDPHAETAAPQPFDDRLPSRGLLSFYDRLRRRIVRTVERRGGKLGGRTAEALLLVPDVFVLLLRLVLDEDVPRSTRILIGSTLAYFVLPVDLLPEALAGPVGFTDDLVLAVAVLSQAFGGDLEPYAEKYWSGPGKLRTVLRDVLDAAHHLVGHDVYGRLRKLLARRGITPSGTPEG